MLKSFRQNLGGVLIDVTLNSATVIAKQLPQAKALLSDLDVAKNLSYRNDSSAARHRLDVYRSRHYSGRRPIFIYIHGGGFRILSKDTHWMMNAILAHQGFCVFSINYGLAPQHRYPEGIHDVFAAVEWVAQNAERFDGDVQQLVIGGESAGANLTCGVGLASSVCLDDAHAQRIFDMKLPIKALAPACGLLEVSNTQRFDILQPDMPKLYRDRIGVICRSYIDDDEANSPLASPLLWFESDAESSRELPSVFVGVGDKDPVYSDSTRLAHALKRRDVSVQSIVYSNAIHAFQAFFWQDNAKRFWREQCSFLSQYVTGLSADAPW